MKTKTNEAPSLRLLIVGCTAILLASSGIAAAMTWVPGSAGGTDIGNAIDHQRTPTEADLRAGNRCAECGVVESTRMIEQREERIDRDAAGTANRVGRNEMTSKVSKVFEVTVRMNDGARHLFIDANPANWRPGERVIFIAGKN